MSASAATAAMGRPAARGLRLLGLQGPAVHLLGYGPYEFGNLGRVSGHLNRLGIDMGQAQHPPGVAPLVGQDQGDHVAGTAGPGRTP